MKSLLSTKYSAGAFSTAMLILRLVAGILMMNHGYGKLTHFEETAKFMPHLFGMSSSITTALVIFAEFFCSLFIILGLFTRLAAIPLIIAMSVAFISVHKMNYGSGKGGGEGALIYLICFVLILFMGPGKASLDRFIGK